MDDCNEQYLVETTAEALKALNDLPERSETQEALRQSISKFRDGSAYLAAIDILKKRRPHFFYTSHFERMSGEISLNQLAHDKQHNKVEPGDKIFLDFLEYAGTTIEELRDAGKYEDLVAQCEGASNDITDEIFEFWSQNEALSVKIDLTNCSPIPGTEKMFSITIDPVMMLTANGPMMVTTGIRLFRKAW